MRPRPRPAAQAGLWGRAEAQPAPTRARPAVNDLELIASVIRIATARRYLVIGPADRVYIRETEHDTQVHKVPSYEADAVRQLLGSGHLSLGGTHQVRAGGDTCSARSVLASKAARSMVNRWAALHPLR